LDAGDREDGLQLLARAVALAEQRGALDELRSTHRRVGEQLAALGEWADAEDAFRRALRAAAEELQSPPAGRRLLPMGLIRVMAEMLIALADTIDRQGRRDEAGETLQQTLTLLEPTMWRGTANDVRQRLAELDAS
jgi:tetratricopeptide (TPR) repeat protein